MLVIGRKKGEYLVLNDNIFIKVLKSDEDEDGRVRLAITAPDDIRIVRGEIFGTRQELKEQMELVQAGNLRRNPKKARAEKSAV